MSNYKNILVAVDFSVASESVLEKACTMAKLHTASLHLLHVVEYLPPVETTYEPVASPDWLINEEELVKNAEERLNNISCSNMVETVSKEVVIGTPKHEIVRIAEQTNADLIVIGSHGRHGFARLLGSTASPVLHNTPCDILAVKISEK